MPLIMLDGFIAGIASLDRLVMPSEWYEHVGVSQATFSSKDEFQTFITLLTNFYNSVINDLLEESYEALLIDEEEKELHLSSKLWASGYIKGLMLDSTEWLESAPTQISAAFSIISIHSLPEEEASEKICGLFFNGKFSHAHDCGCPSHTHLRVGRNAPCPCGSGKKYNKCCPH